MANGSNHGKRALVTGGAGLIGSHLVDLLLQEGWTVRILDNLEPQTHRNGKPPWVPEEAEFRNADIRDRDAVRAALEDVDVVFHQAAYGGYMPEISKYVHVNSFGTAQMLEIIRDEELPIRKVVVASSQAVYSEGAAVCTEHDLVFPETRSIEQLHSGDYAVRCPICDGPTTPTATPEEAPMGGETVYALTKVDQERLALIWGRQTSIPVVALRYSCAYGPRQSVFNPYTGVIAIFCTRLMNDQPPLVYEDGKQSRDLIFVEDVARANMLVAQDDRANGRVFNVGTDQAMEIGALASLLAERLGKLIAPLLPGQFRPGEMRALISDISRIGELGFAPEVDLATGIDRYLNWIRTQGDIKDYFAAAERGLRRKAVVKQSGRGPQASQGAA